jgi:putative ABC transport system permease protein
MRAHPLRSALTALGVIVGVAAVVAVMAIGEGTRLHIIAQIQSLGGNLLLITPGSEKKQGVSEGGGSAKTLTADDARAIAQELPGIVVAAPSVFERTRIVQGNANWATTLQGITNDYLIAREWRLAGGRPFSTLEERRGAKVVYLGQTVVDRVFAGDDPIGRLVRIGGAPYAVVAVLEAKGQSSAGADQDDKIMIPLSTALARNVGPGRPRSGAVQYIMVKVAAEERLATVPEEIRRLLRQRHGLWAERDDDFTIRNLADVQATREAATGALTFWLSAVASISLVVGGISIMNIMLVSVTERTREIGLRLAVGARPADIRGQFLAEASLLSVFGALVGLAVGIAAATTIGAVQDLPIRVRPVSLGTAAGFALLTGLAFGFYPALKASRLSPAEALRTDG